MLLNHHKTYYIFDKLLSRNKTFVYKNRIICIVLFKNRAIFCLKETNCGVTG